MSIDDNAPCPCCSEKMYQHCCLPFHQKAQRPETAEQLMRSRYSAFHLQLACYLLETRHSSQCHLDTLEQLQQTFASTRWLRLDILKTEKGLTTDCIGYVTFAAHYLSVPTTQNKEHVLIENSQFRKEQGQWFYVGGNDIIGRNVRCWCGSGKKFKKCHGRS